MKRKFSSLCLVCRKGEKIRAGQAKEKKKNDYVSLMRVI